MKPFIRDKSSIWIINRYLIYWHKFFAEYIILISPQVITVTRVSSSRTANKRKVVRPKSDSEEEEEEEEEEAVEKEEPPTKKKVPPPKPKPQPQVRKPNKPNISTM